MSTATGRSTTRTRHELTNARTRIVGSRDGLLADAIVWLARATASVRHTLATALSRLAAVVTPVGWALAGVVVLSFVVGYALGWTEAIVAAWSGAALLAIAVGYLVGRVSYGVGVHLPIDHVVVGEKAPAEIHVVNPGRRRIGSARVEVPVGDGYAEFAVPSLGRAAEFTDVFLVPTTRRGIIPIGPVRSVRGDPVGVLRRESVWGEAVDLYVHPRIIAIPSMSVGFVRDLEGSPTRDLTASDVSFNALREYVPGDERRTIHWKSTAKTGSFMVRQFEETRRSHLLVALSLAEADYGSADEFELAVSVAGSLGVRAIRDGRTVAVVASERTPDFAKRAVLAVRSLPTVTPVRLLDGLAGVEPAGSALRLADLARVAADGAVGTSIAFLVCGSTPAPAELRHAGTRFAAGVEVVAVVCDPGVAPSLTRVAELSVLTIGYLEDLQKALARSRAT